MAKIYTIDNATNQLIRVLRSLLGSDGVDVLGKYELISTVDGSVLGTESAITLEWSKDTEYFKRVIKGESGIECVIRGEVDYQTRRMLFSATQKINKFQVVLDQHNPAGSLDLAVGAIYAHPLIAPFDNPQIRQRMRSPDGGIQSARAILSVPISTYQPSLF